MYIFLIMVLVALFFYVWAQAYRAFDTMLDSFIRVKTVSIVRADKLKELNNRASIVLNKYKQANKKVTSYNSLVQQK